MTTQSADVFAKALEYGLAHADCYVRGSEMWLERFQEGYFISMREQGFHLIHSTDLCSACQPYVSDPGMDNPYKQQFRKDL